MKMISVVVPMYNEEDGIIEFLDKQLMPVIEGLKYNTEVILVDDGSVDKTVEKVVEKYGENGGKRKIKIIVLARNFGKEIALTAGLNNVTGDAAIMIDADGQHPVEMIPKMIEKWENGAYVVTAVRDENTTKHKMGSRVYYRIMKMCGNKNIVVGAMDYRLLDRSVVEEFNRMPEHNRLARGLVDWLGYSQEYVKVHTKNRMNGKPTYSHKKLMALTIDGLASTSRTPLVIFGYIGVGIMVISLVLGVFVLIQQYILGDPLGLDWSGAVVMSIFISFLVGLVLVSQAITALYISQIHTESKGRPLYVIDKRKSIGVKNEKK